MTGYAFHQFGVDAPLTGASVDRSGRHAAFAGGDGAVRILDLSDAEPSLSTRRLSQGAVLTLTADCKSAAFVCGDDDGKVYRVCAKNEPRRLAVLERAWPDQLATHPNGTRAIADGTRVRLLDGAGRPSGVLGPHPSTVAGLAFDDAGRRLAVSHYNGVTVWQLDVARCLHKLFHRGSHLQLSWRSDGRFVATATQEKTVHAWDLRSGETASLGQCFNKVKALGWSADGQWLLASGNDTVSAWPFESNTDEGDSRQAGLPPPAPRMLGRFSEQFIALVRPHPRLPLAAAAYNDGGLELVGLPPAPVRHALAEMTGSPLAAMAWSPTGDHLIGGDQDGRFFVCRFDPEWLAALVGPKVMAQ